MPARTQPDSWLHASHRTKGEPLPSDVSSSLALLLLYRRPEDHLPKLDPGEGRIESQRETRVLEEDLLKLEPADPENPQLVR